MPTQNQKNTFYRALKAYKKKYLVKQYLELDESATRLMINYFLTDVLGYQELEEIKTEYAIKGTYADYVIQLERKKHLVVEVKAIQIDLSENHLRQAVSYAANEAIYWILLTNGRQMQLYKVVFGKPISYKRVCDFDLSDETQLKQSIDLLIMLTKKEMRKKSLEHFWKHFQTLEPKNLCKLLYATEVVRFLKRTLKKQAGLNFSEEDIFDSIHQIIITKIQSTKPKSPTIINKKQVKKAQEPHTLEAQEPDEEIND